jgi:hypothetical protein
VLKNLNDPRWKLHLLQLEQKLDTSIAVVNHPDDFAEEIRATLRSIRTTSTNELLLELTLVDEAASRLAERSLLHAHSKVMNSSRRPHTLTGWVQSIPPPLAPKVRACALWSESFEVASTYRLVGRGHSRSIEWLYRYISWMFSCLLIMQTLRHRLAIGTDSSRLHLRPALLQNSPA